MNDSGLFAYDLTCIVMQDSCLENDEDLVQLDDVDDDDGTDLKPVNIAQCR